MGVESFPESSCCTCNTFPAISRDNCPLWLTEYDATTFAEYVAIVFEDESSQDSNVVGTELADTAIYTLQNGSQKMMKAIQEVPAFKKVVLEQLLQFVKVRCPNIELTSATFRLRSQTGYHFKNSYKHAVKDKISDLRESLYNIISEPLTDEVRSLYKHFYDGLDDYGIDALPTILLYQFDNLDNLELAASQFAGSSKFMLTTLHMFPPPWADRGPLGSLAMCRRVDLDTTHFWLLERILQYGVHKLGVDLRPGNEYDEDGDTEMSEDNGDDDEEEDEDGEREEQSTGTESSGYTASSTKSHHSKTICLVRKPLDPDPAWTWPNSSSSSSTDDQNYKSNNFASESSSAIDDDSEEYSDSSIEQDRKDLAAFSAKHGVHNSQLRRLMSKTYRGYQLIGLDPRGVEQKADFRLPGLQERCEKKLYAKEVILVIEETLWLKNLTRLLKMTDGIRKLEIRPWKLANYPDIDEKTWLTQLLNVSYFREKLETLNIIPNTRLLVEPHYYSLRNFEALKYCHIYYNTPMQTVFEAKMENQNPGQNENTNQPAPKKVVKPPGQWLIDFGTHMMKTQRIDFPRLEITMAVADVGIPVECREYLQWLLSIREESINMDGYIPVKIIGDDQYGKPNLVMAPLGWYGPFQRFRCGKYELEPVTECPELKAMDEGK
ncbi:hypothetical protein ABW21_db0202042 [Orbilia brochopaga]|nr:hypothetical protein ABW21_db0202042 [Drechslerella brochopaga]